MAIGSHREQLKNISVPTLIVWGSDDRIVPINCGELYKDAIPNSRFEVINQTGHFVEMEKPEDLSNLIFEFTGS